MARIVKSDAIGGTEVLRFKDLEVGEPGAGEARLHHVAADLEDAPRTRRAPQGRKTKDSSIFVL
ncbi:hypothetical protein [Pantoea sp. 18069]|uniref:hypothetical protein n=1 Tax=Pantoea sp. 18069 TaxID=2681415 RepID=UPI00135A0AB4|nr:hypothetical protein [Pantoea sp. 18069]